MDWIRLQFTDEVSPIRRESWTLRKKKVPRTELGLPCRVYKFPLGVIITKYLADII